MKKKKQISCMEAQSNILNFINRNLDDEESERLILHVRSCSECYDELEINYIMQVGMRLLEEEDPSAGNFRKELREDLDERMRGIARNRNINRIVAGVCMGLLAALSVCVAYQCLLAL